MRASINGAHSQKGQHSQESNTMEWGDGGGRGEMGKEYTEPTT